MVTLNSFTNSPLLDRKPSIKTVWEKNVVEIDGFHERWDKSAVTWILCIETLRVPLWNSREGGLKNLWHIFEQGPYQKNLL